MSKWCDNNNDKKIDVSVLCDVFRREGFISQTGRNLLAVVPLDLLLRHQGGRQGVVHVVVGLEVDEK